MSNLPRAKSFHTSESNTHQQTTGAPPKKRIVICCDGTWQSSNHGLQSIPSNIAKISRSLAKYSQEKDGTIVHQIVFYDAGVGTATDSVESRASGASKTHQGAYGEGLDENVCEAYNFIVNNYNKGDELYFFGFSRGAYTARATAGLVARTGICTNSMMDDFYAMYKVYKTKKADELIEDSEWGKSNHGQQWIAGCDHNVSIKVVGVFDTVGALGWPNSSRVDVSAKNAPYAFHNTAIHPEIENAFHALALDEHRAAFPPTLWSLPKVEAGTPGEVKPPQKTTNLIQCWFPGYHINIGGGSDDMLKERKGDFESMANITFAWMVDRVQQFTELAFDEEALFTIIERYAENITEIIKKQNIANKNGNQVYAGWGLGPQVDSMSLAMMVAGSVIRTPAEYFENRTTNEYIHPVVGFALENPGNKWKPRSLNGFKRIPSTVSKDASPPKGYMWQKIFTPPPEKSLVGKAISGVYSYVHGKAQPATGTKSTITIPEWVLPPDQIVDGAYECEWGHSMERHLIRADTSRYLYDDEAGSTDRKEVVERTIAFVKKMDAENGFEASPLRIYDSSLFRSIEDGFTLVPQGQEKATIAKAVEDHPIEQTGFQ